MVSSKIERRKHKVSLANKTSADSTEEKKSKKPKITAKDIFFLVIGIIGLVLGAQFLVESVIELSAIKDTTKTKIHTNSIFFQY